MSFFMCTDLLHLKHKGNSLVSLVLLNLFFLRNFLNFLVIMAMFSSSSYSEPDDALKARTFFLGCDYSYFFLFCTCTSYAIKFPTRFFNVSVERSLASSTVIVFFFHSGVSAWSIFLTIFT